jgi:hypothetical protein
MKGTRSRFLVSSPTDRADFRDEPSNLLIQRRKNETILHRVFYATQVPMMLNLLAAVILMPAAQAPQTVFACQVGRKQATITRLYDRLEYRFGSSGQPELILSGGPDGGVYYHRKDWPRGEDQTLRFVRGTWSYLIFNRWQAPPSLQPHGRVVPEYNVSGLLVMKGGTIVGRINCDKGRGDLREWPIFKRLRRDKVDLTPDDA